MARFWRPPPGGARGQMPPPAPSLRHCENEIAEMWQDHYKSILNSVKTNSRQQFVTSKLSSIRGESILFSTSDINVALHSLKSGKSCGVDGLAAEHFLFAHRITHVFLSILFNTFILHGYLPADFMKTAIVPIIKNKMGDTIVTRIITDLLHFLPRHQSYLKFAFLKF